MRTDADAILFVRTCLLFLSSCPSTVSERRDERVGDWRDYMHKEKGRKVKKAKKNLHVLG